MLSCQVLFTSKLQNWQQGIPVILSRVHIVCYMSCSTVLILSDCPFIAGLYAVDLLCTVLAALRTESAKLLQYSVPR